MPAVTIRNLSEATHKALRDRARRNGRSTEAEIRSILDSAAGPEPQRGLADEIRDVMNGAHVDGLAFERDPSPAVRADFST